MVNFRVRLGLGLEFTLKLTLTLTLTLTQLTTQFQYFLGNLILEYPVLVTTILEVQ